MYDNCFRLFMKCACIVGSVSRELLLFQTYLFVHRSLDISNCLLLFCLFVTHPMGSVEKGCSKTSLLLFIIILAVYKLNDNFCTVFSFWMFSADKLEKALASVDLGV